MESQDLCQYLAWDSDFFGCRIARVAANRLSPETIEGILAWCDAHRIDCLYFLADGADGGTVRLAEDHRFRFVDIRLTLERQLGDVGPTDFGLSGSPVRLCRSADVQILQVIARVSHRDSRFYYDSNFPASRCAALYETWIEKSCQGHADAVLVAQSQEQPVGYISCHLLDQSKGQIGLVGIDPEARGQRLGKRLINASLRWFAERGIREVTVVTQGRNCQAQRLYQKCGFRTLSVQLWYHRWFPPRGT